MAENGETHSLSASRDRTHMNINIKVRFSWVTHYALKIGTYRAYMYVIEVEAVDRAPIAELK